MPIAFVAVISAKIETSAKNKKVENQQKFIEKPRKILYVIFMKFRIGQNKTKILHKMSLGGARM